MTVEVDHPTLGPAAHPRHADQDVGDAAQSQAPRPMLGEHTDEVLSAAGYSGDEIEQLR